MGSSVQVPSDAWDVLTRQFQQLNEILRQNHLEKIYTELLETSEAAKYLKVSEKHLERLRGTREIKFIQRGTWIRYRKADLDKWLEGYEVG